MASVALFILLLLHLLAASTSAQPADDHQTRCKTHCGDIEIPYPFGLNGTGCAIDKSFEINCRRSAADGVDRPFISDMEMEVLNISVSRGETRALNYIPYYCYNYTTRLMEPYEWYLDLPRPYLYSETRNRFVVIGCNTLAYMYGNLSSVGGEAERYAMGCPAVCVGPENLANGSCSGVGCCESAVPRGLASYNNIYFVDVDDVDVVNTWQFNPCSYAALLEADTFVFSSEYVTTPGKFNESDEGQRPVVLDWAVGGNATCEAASAAGTSACRGANTVCVNSLNGPGYRCNCSSGYQGNPYLPAGCTDVNECESSSSPCPKCATCHNTLGGYQCSCPFGRKFVKETNSCDNQIQGIVIGLSCSIGALVLASISVLLIRKWKRHIKNRVRKAHFRKNNGLLLEQLISSGETTTPSSKIFSLDDLEKATNNFDPTRVLGRGGHGTVYKGILSDQRVVAIKKSQIVEQREIDQFVNEVAILSQIIHRNVVKLFGCCLESEVPLLVYEFISNGTLCEHLHDDLTTRCLLTWDDRIRIAMEAASSLAYLHSAASVPIIHRDIKSANILLTDNFTAKVADFGASRSVPIDETRVVTAVQGTLGYLDPEYYHTCELTEKSDVYSFGVILVELLTRKKPIFVDHLGRKQNLCYYFLKGLQEEIRMMDLVDGQVVEEGNRKQIEEMSSLAGACLRNNGEERPTMKEVELRLQLLRGKTKKKRVHEIVEMNHEIVPLLLPSDCSSSSTTLHDEFIIPASHDVTRSYSMEQELVSWADLPR